MKKSNTKLYICLPAFFLFFLLAGNSTVSAQVGFIQYGITASDFLCDSDFWQDQLGPYAADLFLKFIWFDTFRRSQTREEINAILKKYDIANAYDSDLSWALDDLAKHRVQFLVAGKVTTDQIQEIPGRVTLRVKVEIRLYDLFSNNSSTVVAEREARRDIVISEKIKPDAPFDEKLARKLLGGPIGRLNEDIKEVVRRYYRDRYPRIP